MSQYDDDAERLGDICEMCGLTMYACTCTDAPPCPYCDGECVVDTDDDDNGGMNCPMCGGSGISED